MNINFEISKKKPEEIKVDLFAIACQKSETSKKTAGTLLKADGGLGLDKKLSGIIGTIIKDENFSGEIGETKIIQTHGKVGAKNILLLGIGEKSEFELDTLRIVGAKITEIANELKAKSVGGVIQTEKWAKLTPKDRIWAITEGICLGNYRFDQYKDKKEVEKTTLSKISFIYNDKSTEISKGIDLGRAFAESIALARDLVNTPSDDMTPEALAKESKKLTKAKSLSCKVLNEKAIKKEKMNLLLAVAAGALNQPRLININYKPSKKAKAKIALVGKGVTFDSGGYNLKPSRHIETMKCDMAGAATVIGIMKLLPIIKPNVEVDAYIPATENMIDGKAHKPSDIIKSRNGKTVEIINTDAEGRLIMADAIDYALEKKPDIIIDLATLTGGVRYALGELYTAILGNDQKTIDKLIEASKEGGEPTWQLPLVKEYLKGFKEGPADLNNNGKTFGITISASMFLQEFIGKTKWAHFDIAESAWANEDRDYRTKGGTGSGIQTIARYLMSF